jgi:hypothetical protein
MSTTVCQLKI